VVASRSCDAGRRGGFLSESADLKFTEGDLLNKNNCRGKSLDVFLWKTSTSRCF
jgi:hypothetical protein